MNFVHVLMLLAGIVAFSAGLIIVIHRFMKQGELLIKLRYRKIVLEWWKANSKSMNRTFSVRYMHELLDDIGKGLDGKECKWLD